MKTKFYTAIFLFIISFAKLNAQTSWLVTGNSNTTASNFIGTTNTQPLTIKTNNKERLRILSNGNIGIGTKKPDNTLHIFKGSAGTVTAWPFAPLVVENSAQCYINLLAPDNLETGIFFGKPESNISGGIIYNNTLSGSNSLQFRTGGNNIAMIIDANGNAAVGSTSTNSYRLKVSHDLDGLAIENKNTSTHWELYTSANTGNLLLISQGSLVGSFDASSGAYTALSDERFKTNIHTMSSVLSKIRELKPSTYQFKNASDKQEHNGFIAQDVMKIFPSLVTHNMEPKRNFDVYTLDYSGFGVIAIKGIQELQPIIEKQQQQIEDLQQQIKKQQQEIDELKAMIVSHSAQQSTIISSALLDQNIPNPFNHATTISYTLPQTYSSAKIVVTDKNGKALKEVNVSAKGKGSLNVDATTLASGAYQYSLYVDGKLIDTKQMVLAK